MHAPVCVGAYDIETSITGPAGVFPIPGGEIKSVAFACSCGYLHDYSLLPYNCTLVSSVRELMMRPIELIALHKSQWLLVYNVY